MDHFIEIYTGKAEEYENMIAAEDVDGSLPAALRRAADWERRRVLDLGTGTGRIPRLFGATAQVVGVDLHAAMLRQNRKVRAQTGLGWELVQGDMRRLPVPNAWAEITTAGWAIGHLTGWHGLAWKTEISKVLDEMLRCTAPGGTLVILETLGTGSLEPAPPSPGLAEYYAWLEREWGFNRQVIRTDYQFGSVEQAIALTGFFFGNQLAGEIRRQGWTRLPEWTGLWSRTR